MMNRFGETVDELIRSIAERKAGLDRLRVAAPGGLSNFDHIGGRLMLGPSGGCRNSSAA
jgi:hypothetical protein